jgi:hypothetical protein
MNEAEALAMQGIVEAAVRKIFDEKVTSACADMKAAIHAEVAPIRKSLAELEKLSGAIATLQNQWIKLTASVDSLAPLPTLIAAHREELRELRIKLGFLEGLAPKLDKVTILVDQAIPRLERAIQIGEANRNENAELRQSFTDLEEANGRRASRP